MKKEKTMYTILLRIVALNILGEQIISSNTAVWCRFKIFPYANAFIYIIYECAYTRGNTYM